MRKYGDGQDRKLIQVVCNKCGRALKVENGYLREYCFTADTVFGYFSRRDGMKHHFDLCEDCYNDWINQFRIAVDVEEQKEFL